MLPVRLLSWSLLAILITPGLAQVKAEPAIDAVRLRKEANAAVQAKDFEAAAAAFQKLTEVNAKDSTAWHMLGYSLHSAGKLDAALAAHLKAAEFPDTAPAATYNVACVHALQGRTDEAFTWLDKAVAKGFQDVDLLGTDTDLDSLRKDARFGKLEAAIKAKAAAPGLQVFAQSVDRKNSRVAWFGRTGSPGQLAIDYSPVPWQAKYEEALASGKLQGKKWRLGSDFWTTLDTSVALHCGGVDVPAGYYYLTLEQREGATYVLALHDANAVKKLHTDAFNAAKLQGGIEVPMTHATTEELAKTLQIGVDMTPGSQTEGQLGISFGGHRLIVPVKAEIQ